MPYTPGISLGGLSATLGSVALGTVDASGVAWVLQTLEGWDSPDVRAEFTDREGDHGAWASPVYLGSRPITLAGTIVAPSQALLEAAMEQLRAAAGLTDTQLTVWETLPKQCTVRRSGKVLLQYVTDVTASYSVMVTAEDPRRYGTTQQSGVTGLPVTTGGLTFPAAVPFAFSASGATGTIAAANAGTVETRPVLTVAGPVVAPLVSALYPDGTVRQLAYSQTLQSGEQLVIDTDARTVLLNGVSRRRFLSVPAGWPTIPAASTVTYQFQSGTYSASASLTATWRSAWM
ncbi:phage distal tail protein [Streptomyces sp. NPDC058291]|uniref:phage distal tail protein n=1 Tax=Streptomyces sp. NPDC058291 TaxID=3346427 RepID=UPI0036F05D08